MKLMLEKFQRDFLIDFSVFSQNRTIYRNLNH